MSNLMCKALPMIVQPKPCDVGKIGGYLLDDRDYLDAPLTKKSDMKEISTILDNNIL